MINYTLFNSKFTSISMSNQKPLAIPSPELISTYITKFEQDPATAASDQAVSKAFHAFPHNDRIEEVLLKVAVLNSLYSTNIFALTKVATHIYQLQIDNALAQHSLAIIEAIACIELNGKRRRNYSFATKYCHWHRPDVYPIYDSYVERLLWAYQQQDGFASFRREELQEYMHYKMIHDQFKQYYGLTAFTTKQVDQFLWGYGKEWLKTSSTQKQTPSTGSAQVA